MSRLPAWGRADLPEPLPLSLRNALRTIGPGAILLAASIGGGEWLVGPAVAVKHGVGLFWIATLAIVLQTIFNLEAIRYTLYTGEPIVAGFMRLRPSSGFWATIYTVLSVAQLGMPALGAASATVIFAAFAGQVPGASDGTTLIWLTYLVMAVTLLILMSGGTVERTLERASWAMIAMIFAFLFIANILFVPAEHWLATFRGFFQFGYWPPGVDIVLLTTLAATAGSGASATSRFPIGRATKASVWAVWSAQFPGRSAVGTSVYPTSGKCSRSMSRISGAGERGVVTCYSIRLCFGPPAVLSVCT